MRAVRAVLSLNHMQSEHFLYISPVSYSSDFLANDPSISATPSDGVWVVWTTCRLSDLRSF